jgi:hypothetical protein
MRQAVSGADGNLDLDLDGKVEGRPGHADGASGMTTAFRAEEREDELGEAVDDERMLVEAFGGVHHAECAEPGGDPVEFTKGWLEARENGGSRGRI